MKTPLLFLCASLVFAQTDRSNVTNAHLESRPFSGNLQQQLVSKTPAWFGYIITTAKRHHDGCCWGGEGQYGCGLEGGTVSNVRTVAAPNTPIPLEGSDRIAVLIRVDNAGVGKVRTFSTLCPLDAGGLPFTWIENVPASASIAFLDHMIHLNSAAHVAEGAMAVLAQHEDPEAVNVLIRVAKSDGSAHVRGQALFWLSQKAGQRAASTIVDAIQNDPDTKVKERAVFALSQLPKDEGIPKLIQVATDQRNPEVKKKAFFWLGQSGDPRALAFIEGVLTK